MEELDHLPASLVSPLQHKAKNYAQQLRTYDFSLIFVSQLSHVVFPIHQNGAKTPHKTPQNGEPARCASSGDEGTAVSEDTGQHKKNLMCLLWGGRRLRSRWKKIFRKDFALKPVVIGADVFHSTRMDLFRYRRQNQRVRSLCIFFFLFSLVALGRWLLSADQIQMPGRLPKQRRPPRHLGGHWSSSVNQASLPTEMGTLRTTTPMENISWSTSMYLAGSTPVPVMMPRFNLTDAVMIW